MEIDVTKFKVGDSVEHYIFGEGIVNAALTAFDHFVVAFASGYWGSFNRANGKQDSKEVRHGFIAHTPAKIKHRVNNHRIWVNVYPKDVICASHIETERYQFCIHGTEERANNLRGPNCIATVRGRFSTDEWEE